MFLKCLMFLQSPWKLLLNFHLSPVSPLLSSCSETSHLVPHWMVLLILFFCFHTVHLRMAWYCNIYYLCFFFIFVDDHNIWASRRYNMFALHLKIKNCFILFAFYYSLWLVYIPLYPFSQGLLYGTTVLYSRCVSLQYSLTIWFIFSPFSENMLHCDESVLFINIIFGVVCVDSYFLSAVHYHLGGPL